MSSRTITMTDPIYAYLQEHSLREPEVLRALREETSGIKMAVMQISPEQGQFMALLAKLIGAKRCIEVGVFTGYSALSVALALPADGRIVACDVSEEWTSMARRYWKRAGMDAKIELKLAPAVQTLDALLAAGGAGRYDFAFIDADKTNYLEYYERILKLLRKGGLMTIDNTLWSGKVADPTVTEADTVALRALNDFVHHDARVDMSMLPVGDGLTLVRKT